ncbi:hypothetical protein P3T76_004347 [Phytophthora citrophthora]|uniref:Uncharacterized protein n=1 Tax=Phytophthora citrophthora TaxID=4793 RepID=A0AAD9LP68_9STRA|nr:hypothetical protein P3T76_004347 [Phytophthora citrophthora]
MGVVFQPIDHHEAIQREASPELSPSDVMQPWGRKVQPTTTTTCVESAVELTSLKFATSYPSSPHHLHLCAGYCRLALAPCPLLSLQDSVGNSSTMSWLPETDKHLQLRLSVVKSVHDRRHHSLKRCASVVITSRRGVKRQRVAEIQTVKRDMDQLDRTSVGSPRSLQYAMPNLTSYDTLRVLHTMHSMPSELRHLNGSASRCHLRRRCKVRQVFGWRHLLCQEEEDEKSARRVVWKSAKALESMRMRPLARQIWRASTQVAGGLQGGESGEVLYTVNSTARVVRSMKKQYGGRRRACDQVWLECYLDDGQQIFVARKELRQFSEYRVPESSATELQGFLVRPVYSRMIKSQLAGCSLQCLQAVDARDCGVRSAPALKQRLIDDLPRATLQLEEDYLYDLVETPQVLLDSVFSI